MSRDDEFSKLRPFLPLDVFRVANLRVGSGGNREAKTERDEFAACITRQLADQLDQELKIICPSL